MDKNQKSKIIKIIVFIITILLLISLTIYLFPIMSNLFKPEGREMFKQQIQQNGTTGMFILLGLEMAQILLPILPGEPIEILAGMCYGTIGGFLFITFSVLLITSIIFFGVRKLGRDFVYTIVSKEKIDKLENSKLFKNPKKIEYIMLILFFIPGTPKDLLVYIAGLLPVNPVRFILISSFARFPSIISSTIAGDTLVEGNWHIGLLCYLATFALVGIIVLVTKKLDKSKTTENILNEIQNEKTDSKAGK